MNRSRDLWAVEHRGEPPASVWLHHGVGSARSWASYLPEAAPGRRALAYDRRGFGRSPRGRAITAEMFNEDAADLADLLAARGAAPAHLVGHSDGGTIALLVAARHPELVLSVATVATHVQGDPITIATLRGMGEPARWPPALRAALAADHGEDWEEVAGAWHRLWTSPPWESWSIASELPRVSCPVLVVHDRRDPLSPPLHAEVLAASLPDSRLLWCDTGTHDPHRGDRAGFIAALQLLWTHAEGLRP